MRNVFLTLVLANVLLLAWQVWVDPAPPALSVAGSNGLVLFGARAGRTLGGPLAGQTGAATPEPGIAAGPPPGACLRVGPLPSAAAAQQAGQRLAQRGIDAIPMERDTQFWLGRWVQIGGFASVPEAETARQRLAAGGLPDAYLMHDGTQSVISLGVFRDRSRAERVASAARSLGFEVSIRDRYRQTVEQWLLIRPRPDQTPGPADLSLAGDRIMRTESAPCEAAGSPPRWSPGSVAPGEPPQTL